MLTISKPLSAGQAHFYHAEEFRSARDNYYTAGDQIVGQWHGRLAERWGLTGDVRDAHFAQLADGQHPLTGDQLVRHQTPRTITNARGESTTAMEHRAGWDATFSAPKTVSLTALVGGDDRVRQAHRVSVVLAMHELESYVQARLGGNRPAETTAQWVAATFEHDSARPVNGYAAPQLHTHAVIFNMTETESGDVRPLQPRELYRTQAYATAVYRSELASRLTALGYELERGKSGQPEIVGYSKEYVEASSPRRQQIEDYLTRARQHGAGAAQIAAHQTRDAKDDLSRDVVQAQHREVAAAFGHQPRRVTEAARERGLSVQPNHSRTTARAAVTFAKDRMLERSAVVEERDILRDALTRAQGHRTVAEVKAELAHRVKAGEFVLVEQPSGAPGRAFTTPEMQALEQDTIDRMRQGRQTQPRIASEHVSRVTLHNHPHLSDSQRAAVQQILGNRDQVMALEGVAGAGKTTTLAAVRDAAERTGYRVEGFAPTSRAAQQLADAGISSTTLQHHLSQGAPMSDRSRRLYILDESSLTSTTQMHTFLHRLHANDRVVLVGDRRQHQAVDAGRPYQQLHESGMAVARLDTIVRQQDPALKAVVEDLSHGEVGRAVRRLDAQGRIYQIADPVERYARIAQDYTRSPENTLVVSPDNQSRMDLNHATHRAMQDAGRVDTREHRTRVLVPRQEITGADRQWAERYAEGDIIRYTKGSQAHGIRTGEYARVEHVNAKDNMLTVGREGGSRVTYDPRRLQGVTVYREAERAFANGDRVQFTAPDRRRRIANRELGTIERIDSRGEIRVQLESGRSVTVSPKDNRHLDYGYTVTSHSSQGQTADRVLVNVDTDRAGERLINRRFAYVAVSRSRYDVQIYTNDRTRLAGSLTRDVSQIAALPSPSRAFGPVDDKKAAISPELQTERTMASVGLAR